MEAEEQCIIAQVKRYVYYSDSHNIHYNLALEEYFLRNLDFSQLQLLFIYKNDPCVVLGKNQNFYQEVNLKSFFNSKYTAARRISGGGTVIHDLGNINFAFFERHSLKGVNNYESSVGRINYVLNALKIKASVNDRNAIILENGKKISGSAQFSNKNGILSHLTLLYNSNLENIVQLLHKNKYSIATKASQSVPSPIDNLANHTGLTVNAFVDQVSTILDYQQLLDTSTINTQDILQCMNEKYQNERFIYETAATGIIETEDITIQLDKSFIKNIQGNLDTSFYLNKRLLPTDIPLSDILWQHLLH